MSAGRGRGGGGSGAEGPASVGPEVKICGVTRGRDVDAAADAGADLVGLVLAESPRRVGEDEARDLSARAAGAGLRPVGVFVDRSAEEVGDLADRLGLAVVQLHGREPPAACRSLRAPHREVWKAIRPRSREELEELAGRYEDAADALLVEGFSPEAAGGTGTGFPRRWLRGPDGERIARRLVLAGGLEPGNVAEAIREARPDVVDVSSGVEEAPGRKDHGRIRAFVEAARAAGREVAGAARSPAARRGAGPEDPGDAGRQGGGPGTPGRRGGSDG